MSPDSPSGAPTSLDPTPWQRWWEFNRDPYLRVDEIVRGLASTTGADRRGSPISNEMLANRIVPKLQLALRKGGDIPFLRSTMLAWARIGEVEGYDGVTLEQYARHYLKDQVPELQEAAILALGVEGKIASEPLLRHLLLDDAEGRELMGGMPAGARNRAFAAYALGLVAQQHDDADLHLRIVHSLLEVLGDERTTTRENQVACALAVGLVPLEFCGDDPAKLEKHRMEGDKHLCGGVQLRYLLDVYRDAELDPWLRAHVLPSIGRLGRNAPAEFRTAVADELLAGLDPRADATPELRRSCAIGAGLFADADADETDVVLRKALQKTAQKGEPLARRFALISLAKIAGRPGEGEDPGAAMPKVQEFVLRELARGKDGMKGWAALAAAVLGHSQMEAASVPSEDLSRAIRLSLGRAKDGQDAAACLLALGVLRDAESIEAVRKAFTKSEDAGFKAYASLTLALLGDRESSSAIAAELAACDAGEEGTGFVPEYAVALRLLGEGDVVPQMLQRLKSAEETSERAAVARVLGVLSDSRAVGSLVDLLEDEDVDDSVRASCADALGALCDEDALAWNSEFASDVNYDILTWTLKSPFGDGSGLLDLR